MQQAQSSMAEIDRAIAKAKEDQARRKREMGEASVCHVYSAFTVLRVASVAICQARFKQMELSFHATDRHLEEITRLSAQLIEEEVW